jgi:hypothetical protein
MISTFFCDTAGAVCRRFESVAFDAELELRGKAQPQAAYRLGI